MTQPYRTHTIPARAGRGELVVQFQPSKYLKSEEDLWTLFVLCEENEFLEDLEANGNIIDAVFIESVMEKSGILFYMSADGKKLFPAPFDEIEKEHGPLKKVTARETLDLVSLPVMEDMIEGNRVVTLR